MAPRKGTVLVIDDDRDILAAIREVLEREGYRVDVILLDLLMPAISGWEFLDASVDDERLAAIPVIVISAAPQDIRAQAPHVRAVLQKPFERGALLDLVASHARRG